MPKVSVIIPVYGVEKYIERCARSLFEQTLDDIEYLFIDDCTPDRSVEILKNVLEEYPNRKSQVTIHRMEQNSGQAAVRKWGILNATGDYIIHCDSDDWVDVDMYRAMYEKVVEEDADVVVCDYRQVNSEGNTLNIVKACHAEDIHKFREGILFQRDPWSLWNKMFRKTTYSKELNYPTGAMGEDMVICIQLLFKCNKLTYCPEPYYSYYINPKSITHIRTTEWVISKYMQSIDNFSILSEAIGTSDDKIIKYGLQWLYFRSSNTLLECMDDKEVRLLWRNHFSGKNKQFLLNPHISILRKIRHIYLIIRYL